jgi:hypothetical protein
LREKVKKSPDIGRWPFKAPPSFNLWQQRQHTSSGYPGGVSGVILTLQTLQMLA